MDWGTVPAWVSSVGSVLAFSLATVIFAQNSRDKRMEQARLVTPLLSLPAQRLSNTGTSFDRLRSDIGGLPVTHTGGTHYHISGVVLVWRGSIINLSKEALLEIEATVVDGAGRPLAVMNRLSSIPPEKTVEFTLVGDDLAETAGATLNIAFTDAGGRRWSRTSRGALRRMKSPARRKQGLRDEPSSG